jgi:hypothetical protein
VWTRQVVKERERCGVSGFDASFEPGVMVRDKGQSELTARAIYLTVAVNLARNEF